MSFFNWFSEKPSQPVKTSGPKEARTAGNLEKTEVPLKPRLAAGTPTSEDERKNQRHVRREQLYTAIREEMTRAGVLSATYKFKVLSLDQTGNEFLVMVDIERQRGNPLPALAAIEALIAQNSASRFQIRVPAVYWRVIEVAAVVKPVPPFMAQPQSQLAAQSHAAQLPGKAQPAYEPVGRDEVDAFQQALLAASSYRTAAGSGMGVKIRDVLRFSPAPVRDFQDTEISQSKSSPALSNTQYGELV